MSYVNPSTPSERNETMSDHVKSTQRREGSEMPQRYLPTQPTIDAIKKLYREAHAEPTCHYEDEDTISFTRTELQALWLYVAGTNQELSDYRGMAEEAWEQHTLSRNI